MPDGTSLVMSYAEDTFLPRVSRSHVSMTFQITPENFTSRLISHDFVACILCKISIVLLLMIELN